MKKLSVFGVLMACLALASCRPARPVSGDDATGGTEAVTPAESGGPAENVKPIPLTAEGQIDAMLDDFERNLYVLGMLDFDVVANCDGIIATQTTIENIITMIEESSEPLSPEQQQRYRELREEYRAKTGY